MRLLLSVAFASVLASYAAAAARDAEENDWEFHICQAFNSEGMIVAMQMGRDEALARVKTWEICSRNKLDCWQVQCYEQF